MSIGEMLLILIMILGELGCVYLYAHTKKYAENMADILQNRDKKYEEEKGKNLATKEDVADITKRMEEVKSEISFVNQKKYEQLAEQEKILVEILHEATILSQSQNKLFLYLYDTSTRTRYDNLVENVNDTLTRFYHLCNLAIVSVPIPEIEAKIEELSVVTTYHALQVNVKAANAASLVELYNNQMDYAFNKALNEEVKSTWLASAINTKQQIEQMRDDAVPGKDELRQAMNTYTYWLKQLYGKEFFVFKA